MSEWYWNGRILTRDMRTPRGDAYQDKVWYDIPNGTVYSSIGLFGDEGIPVEAVLSVLVNDWDKSREKTVLTRDDFPTKERLITLETVKLTSPNVKLLVVSETITKKTR